MNSTAMPTSRCRSRIRSMIAAWTVTSSAVVGSSAISNCGRHARAMAIITRWRMPPDKSPGYCVMRRWGSDIFTATSMASAFVQASSREMSWCSR
ncbi:hypothetical protein G6F57_022893 [Rhizopus arrhizus]|nr:hypothetical protein G6F57_022893 [Rhizopus arrhizus]